MLRRYARDYDYALLFLTLALVLFGLVMIRSSQPQTMEANFFHQQIVWVLIGLGAMGLLTAFDYRYLGAWARPTYIIIVLALGMVLLLGTRSFGAQRWFEVIDRQIQPAEFAKLLLIIVMARYLGDREGQRGAFLLSAGLVAIPIVLILLQPNLSTAIIVGAIWLTIAVMAGLPIRWLMVLALLLVVAVPLIWPYVPEYQRDRVLIVQDPTKDPTGQGYNLIQSRIAIGGGGLLGQGYGQGTQSQLGYLRVRHTDFIFSVVAEELGFVGSVLLIALLVALIFRLSRAMLIAQDPFGRLVIAGVAGWVFFQSFVNIGVNLGVVPPTGVPLPFISYGGSNLVTLLLAIGLVQSVLLRQRKLEFD